MLGSPSKRDLLRIIERERVQHRVEIANLLDRIAALADKPWTLPPRETFPDVEPPKIDNLDYLPV